MESSLEQMFPGNTKIIYHGLFFCISLMQWVFNNNDGMMPLKILFLFLPFLLVTVSFWVSLISVASSLFRSNRTKFIATILITWWDAGRSILMYWAGIFKFSFLSFGWFFGALRVSVLGLAQTIKDIIFLPLTVLNQMATNYAKPGIPWIAVSITFLWIGLEAMIFSYVLTPMVSEIMISLTDFEPAPLIVTSCLFIFLFMVIGGSMACMHGLVEAIEGKNPLSIIKMLTIELVVMMVEVVFFYREFVESIIPFFNRMSADGLSLSPLAILGIGAVAWMGIRAGTWFFFGRFGTPTLLMIISREGMSEVDPKAKGAIALRGPLSWIKNLAAELKTEIDWFDRKALDMTEAFVLPPVQILAVITNFVMILLTGKHLFVIPILKISDLKDTKQMIQDISEEKSA